MIRRIVGLDIETTGLLEPGHRIIEFYAGRWTAEGELLAELLHRIDPQRAIAADAQRVHGISGAELVGKPIFAAVAPEIRAFLEDGDLLVGHNGAGFDLPFIDMELERVGLPKLTRPIYDTMACKWSTPSGKPPALSDFCLACDIEYDPAKAHAAAYDVEIMMTAFFRARRWGWINLEGQE